jgi:hypothetical protein
VALPLAKRRVEHDDHAGEFERRLLALRRIPFGANSAVPIGAREASARGPLASAALLEQALLDFRACSV